MNLRVGKALSDKDYLLFLEALERNLAAQGVAKHNIADAELKLRQELSFHHRDTIYYYIDTLFWSSAIAFIGWSLYFQTGWLSNYFVALLILKSFFSCRLYVRRQKIKFELKTLQNLKWKWHLEGDGTY